MARNKSQEEMKALAVRKHECTAMVRAERKLVRRKKKKRKLSPKERKRQQRSMTTMAVAVGVYLLFGGGKQ